jgi:multidrug efflux pump subunit AcrA (membrane-fusion protein)
VLRLRVNSAGAVVREGEVLSEVACAGERLQAELRVGEAGVPQVKPGQAVKLRYDAFPYQRYGVRFGTVRWAGSAGVAVNDTSSFRALVDLADDSIPVRGVPQPLLAGMSGQADVVTGRRSLVSYAIEPIRALRENFRQEPR